MAVTFEAQAYAKLQAKGWIWQLHHIYRGNRRCWANSCVAARGGYNSQLMPHLIA